MQSIKCTRLVNIGHREIVDADLSDYFVPNSAC